MVDGELIFNTRIDNKGYDKGIKRIESGLSDLKSSLSGLAKAAAAAFSVKAVLNFVKTSKEAYDIQLVAETKLATVMRQRLGANDDMIKSIKSLAAQQQELGVIGDEVQLAGAQQIATYAKETDTLKTLIPAMNDLLAQQQGLNATSSDAVNIGNLIGKVLQGQTSALKRVGITFSDAEEQMLKYGNESQRAAMLAQVITNNVGHMNAALAQTDAGKQKQLANTMGDIKEEFGRAITQIQAVFLPVVKLLASGLSKVAEMARSAASAFRELFGAGQETGAEAASAIAASTASAAESYEEMADSAVEIRKEQDAALASFDKIIKLDEPEAETGAAEDAGTGVLPVDIPAAKQETGKLADFFKRSFDTALRWVKDNFGDTFNGIWEGFKKNAVDSWSIIKKAFGDVKTLGEPLRKVLNTKLIPVVRKALGFMGRKVNDVWERINKSFSDIWNIAVFPVLQDMVNIGLPLASDFFNGMLEVQEKVWEKLMPAWDALWEEVVKPILEGAKTLIHDVLVSLSEFWEKWGQPIVDGIKEAIETTAELISEVWEKYIKPVWETLKEIVSELWDEHLKPLMDNILDFIGELVTAATTIYNEFIAPIISWVVDKFGPLIAGAVKNLWQKLKTIFGGIADAVNGVVEVFKGIIKFIKGVFTGDWESAWEGIKTIFKGIWDKLVGIVKVPINLIIGLVNGMVHAIESAVNFLIDGLNFLSFDVPDWVPLIGGAHFGFDISHVDIPEIPYLARGTVVPANFGEFAAILGDNKREPEIVSPISTMKQALSEAMAEHGGKQPMVLNLSLDTRRGRKLLSQQVIDDINDIINSTGAVPINL